MKIFDAVDRDDGSPCGHAEGTFRFLNRVASHPFGLVRDELERWFGKVPAQVRRDLRARLRSNLDRHFLAAFWELYLHEVFRRQGYDIEPHPTLDVGTTRPDFLMHGRGDSFYVEAKVLFDADLLSTAARNEATIRDTLDRVRSENFLLCLQVLSRGDSPLAVSRHRPAIEAWLAALDPDDVHERLLEANDDVVGIASRNDLDLRYDISEAGWHLRLEPVPVVPEARGQPGRAVGVFWPYDDDRPIDDITPLRRALERKAGRYGDPGRPLIVAVLVDAPFSTDTDVEAALYGTRAITYTQRLRPHEQTTARWGRLRDGLFLDSHGPRRVDLSAVLSVHGLQPWTVASTAVSGARVWRHPWARHPLSASLPFATRELDHATGQLRAEPEIAPPHALLGLPPGWPGFEGSAALPSPDW